MAERGLYDARIALCNMDFNRLDKERRSLCVRIRRSRLKGVKTRLLKGELMYLEREMLEVSKQALLANAASLLPLPDKKDVPNDEG
jgi:hypothetical protein